MGELSLGSSKRARAGIPRSSSTMAREHLGQAAETFLQLVRRLRPSDAESVGNAKERSRRHEHFVTAHARLDDRGEIPTVRQCDQANQAFSGGTPPEAVFECPPGDSLALARNHDPGPLGE